MKYGLTEIPMDPAPAPLLTLEQAKLHLRVDHSAEDSLIIDQVLAATRIAEQYTRRAFVERAYRMTLDAFPRAGCVGSHAPQDGQVWPPRFGNLSVATRYPDAIVLPLGPLLTVTAIAYDSNDMDEDGQPIEDSVSAYRASNAQWPPRITPRAGECWPCTADVMDAVRIDFVAGYGAPGDVPQDIKAAVKLILGSLHEHREDELIGSATQLPRGAEALLSPYRIFRV